MHKQISGSTALVVLCTTACSSLAVCVVMSVGQKEVKKTVVDADAIQVRDSEGRIRIRLGVSPDNKMPGIFLFSESGAVVGQFLVADGDKPELHLSDSSFGWKASLMVAGPDNDPRLVFWGKKGSTLLPVAAIGSGDAVPWISAGAVPCDRGGYVDIRSRDGISVLKKP